MSLNKVVEVYQTNSAGNSILVIKSCSYVNMLSIIEMSLNKVAEMYKTNSAGN